MAEKTNKTIVGKKKRNIKNDYFYGIGVLIANKLNLSAGYVRDVLNEKFPERRTRSTRMIKELAKDLVEKQNVQQNDS